MTLEILLIQFIMSMLGTIGFSVLFFAPKSDILLCGTVGAIGWIVYYVLYEQGMPMLVATVIGAVCLTFCARLLAVIRKKPVSVYLFTGIFPLVPGSGIYYTAYYIVKQNHDMALFKLVQTVGIAAAIAFGILLAFSMPQKFLNQIGSRFRR